MGTVTPGYWAVKTFQKVSGALLHLDYSTLDCALAWWYMLSVLEKL